MPSIGLLILSIVFRLKVEGNQKVFNSLSFTHFGWFSAGSAYYVFYKNRDWRWRCIALSFSVVSSVFVRDHSFESIMAALLMSGLFFLSMTNAGFQNILSNRLFLFFGFISYPLYLIHDNAMISLILKSSRYDIGIPYFFIPFIPVVILSAVAFIIAKYGEAVIRLYISAGLTHQRKNVINKRCIQK